MNNFNELHNLEYAIFFSSQTDDDRKENEKEKEQEQEEQEEIQEEKNSDWGDVDPAGGPTPTAPGSAV
jgi:hypothetical protein